MTISAINRMAVKDPNAANVVHVPNAAARTALTTLRVGDEVIQDDNGSSWLWDGAALVPRPTVPRVIYGTGQPTAGAFVEGDMYLITETGTPTGTVFASFVYDADSSTWTPLLNPGVVTVSASRALLPSDFGKTLLCTGPITLTVPGPTALCPVGWQYFLCRVRLASATGTTVTIVLDPAASATIPLYIGPSGSTIALQGDERNIELVSNGVFVS